MSDTGTCTDWRERERAKVRSGEYKRVPWDLEEWAQRVAGDHFAHVSTEDPSMLAYTESEAKGAADRQTRVRPGRYLKRYFGDVLSDEQIAKWAEYFAAVNEPHTLRLATTADDIEHVYVNGPRSCMAGEQSTPEHPVRAYAAGDLAIAYLAEGESIKARALCWPERKVCGRIYGDAARLAATLERAGYTADNGRGFDGARLAKIELDCGVYLMPYLDNGYRVADRGSYWEMGSSGDYAQNTEGTIGGTRCDHCRDYCSPDETFGTDNGSICETCYSEHYFTCERCESIYHVDNAIAVNGLRRSQSMVCDGCAASDARQCADCGEHFIEERCYTRHDNETVCDGCADNYSACEGCGELHENDAITVCEPHNEGFCEGCAPDNMSHRVCCGEVWRSEHDCNCDKPAPPAPPLCTVERGWWVTADWRNATNGGLYSDAIRETLLPFAFARACVASLTPQPEAQL